MKLVFQRLTEILLLTIAIALVYYTYATNYGRQLNLYLALYSIGLLYHLLFDKKKSRLFIAVFALFVVSAALGVGFFYETARPRPDWYVYAGNLFAFFGFLLMLIRLFKDFPPKWALNKWSVLILIILGINMFFGYEIVLLVKKYNLSFEHFFFGFFYTLFKMLLLSAGLIFYVTNMHKKRKLSLLVGAFICFFLSDIIDTLNSLMFKNDPIQGADILFSGLLCLALCFFYMYCTSPISKDEQKFL